MKRLGVDKSFKQKIQPTNTNRKPITINAWAVWVAAAIFYWYEMILRAGASVMAQGIMDTFTINATQLGLLTSFYYYSYVLLQVPSGMLLDKIGPRFVITFSCILCTIGSWFFATTTSLATAEISRFVVGAGSACAFVACLKLASDWFSPARFAFIAGLTNMLGTLGGTFAGVPLAKLVNHTTWQQATIWLAYAGVIVTTLCWVLIRNKPKNKNADTLEPTVRLRKSLMILAFDKQIILAAAIGGLMYVPVSSFAELWAVPFLMNSLAINNEWASFANTMIFIGMAVGSPIIAKLAFKQKSYIKLMKVSAIACAVCFLIGSYAQSIGYFPTLIALFVGGLWLGGQVLCFSVVKERVPNQASGTAMAYTNAIVMLSGVIFQPMMGWLLDRGWTGDLDGAGTRIYSAADYHQAVLAVPACLALSWLLLKLCKDTHPKLNY
ncbi:MAG: MFS transporter [Pseudomonadota bacterium]|nr:MFS transporter [Alphaproteobacteria bacterium]